MPAAAATERNMLPSFVLVVYACGATAEAIDRPRWNSGVRYDSIDFHFHAALGFAFPPAAAARSRQLPSQSLPTNLTGTKEEEASATQDRSSMHPVSL